jgi:PKD repeat protein
MNSGNLLLIGVMSLLIFSCEKENIDPILKADFNTKSTIVNITDTVKLFNNSSNTDVNDTSLRLNWYFEGGTPSVSDEFSPSVVYYKPGQYSVKLVIKNKYGKDSIFKSNYIKVQSTLENRLVAFYSFDGNANNDKGNNNGSVFGAKLCKDQLGDINKAYYFSNPESDRIECGIDPVGDDSSLSVSVNIYPVIPQITYSDLNIEYIISSGAQTLCAGYYMIWDNGKIKMGRHTIGFACDTTFGNYESSSWYNLIMTYDKNDKSFNVFVNGTNVISTKAISKSIDNHKFNKLFIGAANTASLYNYQWTFNGIIDQVRIYDRVLNDDEIREIYLLKSRNGK